MILKQRKLIDKIDEEILSLLKRRFQVIKQISKIKLKYDLPVKDEKRINEILTRRLRLAKKYRIPAALVKKIFSDIIFYSMEDEKRVTRDKK